MGRTGSRISVLAYCLAVMALFVTGIWLAVGSGSEEVSAATNIGGGTTFPGTNTGSIPDNLPAGRVISFNVTGVSAPASDVRIDITATHSWIGDLTATLTAPGGTSHTVFARPGRTGGTGFGTNSDLAGTYGFNDDLTSGDLWAAAAANPITPPGNYRTSGVGSSAATVMTSTFSALGTLEGTWTLTVVDAAGGDTGSISAANLTITGGAAPTGSTFTDFDGDGKSDPSVVRSQTSALRSMSVAGSYRERLELMARNKTDEELPTNEVGPPTPGSNIGWYINNSAGSPSISSFGEPATDFVVPQDFDGDGKADIAVWRGIGPTGPGAGYFFIMNSGTMTVDTVDFGVQGDDPTVAGDYDGDGKADPAVFRCPPTDGQCFYYYKGSAGGGEITYVPWGFGTPLTLFPAIGDFDGDGKYDFNLQRTNPAAAGQGQFVLLRSGDGGVEYIDWGLNTDLIAPGDYDGDGKTDIAIGRSVSGARQWWILERDGGTQAATWGLTGDRMTPGDFDGDGKTDVAVWRPSDGNFYIYNSGSNTVTGFNWGLMGDYPLANFQVH